MEFADWLEFSSSFTAAPGLMKDLAPKELVSSYQLGLKDGRKESLVTERSAGEKLCKSHILHSPASQSFLDVLLKELPEAYLRSYTFCKRIDEVLSHWTFEIVDEVCEQLALDPGKADEVDGELIVKKLLAETPGIEVPKEHGESYPWYLDPMKCASGALAHHPGEGIYKFHWGQVDYHVLPQSETNEGYLKTFLCLFTPAIWSWNVEAWFPRPWLLLGTQPQTLSGKLPRPWPLLGMGPWTLLAQPAMFLKRPPGPSKTRRRR